MDKLMSKWNKNNIFQLLPIIIFSALVPLIIYTRFLVLDDFTALHWTGEPVDADIFSFYKTVVVIGCAMFSLILLVINLIRKKNKLHLSIVTVFSFIYILLIILSSVFSDYSKTAFWGSPQRYEGAVTLISYLIMFLYTLTFVDTIKKVHIVFTSIIISSFIIAVFSVLQFFGFSLFDAKFFRLLINMDNASESLYDVNIIHAKYTSFATMANPNNLSYYLALVTPLVVSLFATIKTKKAVFISGFMIYLVIITLFGAYSSGGYYAVIISTLLLIALSFTYIKKNIINIVVLLVMVIGMLIVTNIFTDNRINEKIMGLRPSSELNAIDRESKLIYIDNIILGEDEVFIDTTDKAFTVKNVDNIISIRDISDKDIPVFVYDEGQTDTFPGDIILFENPEYSNYIIAANDNYTIFTVTAGLRVMYFHMTDDGIKVPAMGNTLDVINPIERNAFLYKNASLFSGRGYIWSGMLPLLRDTIILGNGPDTSFLTYPQNDYIGKINMTGTSNVIIEKPHNYYLQIAHDTGWISLFLLLALFVYYFIDTIILLVKNKKGGLWRIYSISSLCGIFAYLIASLMYDSSVLTAPVFWTILAIGISLNKIGKKSISSLKQTDNIEISQETTVSLIK